MAKLKYYTGGKPAPTLSRLRTLLKKLLRKHNQFPPTMSHSILNIPKGRKQTATERLTENRDPLVARKKARENIEKPVTTGSRKGATATESTQKAPAQVRVRYSSTNQLPLGLNILRQPTPKPKGTAATAKKRAQV